MFREVHLTKKGQKIQQYTRFSTQRPPHDGLCVECTCRQQSLLFLSKTLSDCSTTDKSSAGLKRLGNQKLHAVSGSKLTASVGCAGCRWLLHLVLRETPPENGLCLECAPPMVNTLVSGREAVSPKKPGVSRTP